MKNTIINRGVIKKVAKALGELNEKVVFVGGAVVSLYINDPAAEDIRPTKDVDISMEIFSLVELEEIRKSLIKKGFKQNAEDNVICRFRYEDVKVDVMATKEIGWAPSDKWFAPGFKNLRKMDIDGQEINIMSLPYFLATKFSAFNDRDGTDPRTSHDFEDIVYILDNNINLVEQIKNAPEDAAIYLESEFSKILSDTTKIEALYANLFYETREQRGEMIIKKLNEILNR